MEGRCIVQGRGHVVDVVDVVDVVGAGVGVGVGVHCTACSERDRPNNLALHTVFHHLRILRRRQWCCRISHCIRQKARPVLPSGFWAVESALVVVCFDDTVDKFPTELFISEKVAVLPHRAVRVFNPT